MSRELLVEILLWYNVLSLAIWCGGTVFSMLVIVPLWSASPPESVRAFFLGTDFKRTVFRFFGPVTQIARALPLFALVIVAWPYANVRPWLIVPGATMLFGIVFTRAYVYRINDVLMLGGEGLPADDVRSLVRRWVIADRARFAIMAVGYVCLLRAFTMPLGV